MGFGKLNSSTVIPSDTNTRSRDAQPGITEVKAVARVQCTVIV